MQQHKLNVAFSLLYLFMLHPVALCDVFNTSSQFLIICVFHVKAVDFYLWLTNCLGGFIDSAAWK